jgi:hypothetical protein
MAGLEVRCKRCQTRASLPLDPIRRPRDTPIWKLGPALKCRSCRTTRYSPPVHMIKLTQQREIASYAWVHPDDDELRLPFTSRAIEAGDWLKPMILFLSP